MIESEQEMKNILLEFIMSHPDQFDFLMDVDGKIKIKKIIDITYFDFSSGKKYYNGRCETEYKGGTSYGIFCVNKKELKLIERKYKINKIINGTKSTSA